MKTQDIEKGSELLIKIRKFEILLRDLDNFTDVDVNCYGVIVLQIFSAQEINDEFRHIAIDFKNQLAERIKLKIDNLKAQIEAL